jgi:hypothetical protein
LRHGPQRLGDCSASGLHSPGGRTERFDG